MTPATTRSMTDSVQFADIRVSLAERLSAFDPGGTLVADARMVATHLAGHEEALMAAFWERFLALPITRN
jgi:hypothetical protein